MVRSAFVCVVLLAHALYNDSPGLPGDMALPLGTETQFVASPSLAHSGFRRDEISSSWTPRVFIEQIFGSPNCSAIVGTTPVCLGAFAERVQGYDSAEISAEIRPFPRKYAQNGPLGGIQC